MRASREVAVVVAAGMPKKDVYKRQDLDLEGEIQVASFHPQYQFAGTQAEDIENHTNRSPYPTLHLLREASIERALAAVPNPDAIYENNILRLRALGIEGWRALWGDGGEAGHGAGPTDRDRGQRDRDG